MVGDDADELCVVFTREGQALTLDDTCASTPETTRPVPVGGCAISARAAVRRTVRRVRDVLHRLANQLADVSQTKYVSRLWTHDRRHGDGLGFHVPILCGACI